MSVLTKTAGYPVHAVAAFVRWTNPWRANFTDWVGQCGGRGTDSGHRPFETAGSARSRELCPACFPGQDWNNCKDVKPQELTSTADLGDVASGRVPLPPTGDAR